MPLFVEELTKAMMETGESAVPASLHGSLMARLDRAPEVKEVAQVAACIGREFDLALLKAVCEQPDAVAPAIDKLMAAELVFLRGNRTQPRYTFKHALVQEAARASLLNRRREALHARILGVLERQYPNTPREVLAQHAAAAGLVDQAIAHWSAAGKAAQGHSAYTEAAACLESAITLIHARPADPDLLAQELDLQMRLGQCYMGMHGLASEPAKQAFLRANELLRSTPCDRDLRLAVQYGMWNWHYANGELRSALHLGREALAAEEAEGTQESLLVAQRMVATTCGYLGDFSEAQALYEQAMPMVQSERCQQISSRYFLADQRIAALYQYSVLRCLQGHTAPSRELMDRARQMCVASTPVLQRAYLYLLAALRAALERDAAMMRTELSSLIDLATRHRMLLWFDGFTDMLGAWAASDCGPLRESEIACYRGGLGKLEASGQHLFLPYLMTCLATGLSGLGCHDEASMTIDRAFALCEETAQDWCDAELWRVRGEILQRVDHQDPSRAIQCFSKAIELARTRGATLWELRAALSLARLQASLSRPTDALAVLAPVCAWFDERVAIADIVEARALLGELGGQQNVMAQGDSGTPPA